MFDSDQLCCERCGGAQFSHFREDPAGGEPRWWNRCQDCGAVSEFMPTLEEIQRECLKIRAEQNAFEVTDATEKFWRNQEAEQRARREEMPDDQDEVSENESDEREAA